jgi:predicted phage baseplate assembly protein
MYAFVVDVLGFYQDNQALNSRIVTATQRRALLGLVKLIGYTPATASAATVDITITLPSSPTNDVTFEAGSFAATEEVTNPIRYQLLADAVISAGASPATVTVTTENSEPPQTTHISSGLANQEIVLPTTPYLDDSAVPVWGDGTYTQVDSFLDSEATDRHFTVTVDQNDQATLRYGNGVNGSIPVGSGITTYKIGGGSAGRVEAGALRKLEGSFFDGTVLTQPTVTNPAASSGGTDRESVEQIKVNAPATLRVLNRTVAREDYEINALRVAGVSRALMLTSNEDSGVQENNGILIIIPDGGGLPSTSLKASVHTMVTETFPSTLTFQVAVQDPVYKTINVSMRVAFLQGFTKATVAAAIRTALTDFFAESDEDGVPNENVDFGGKITDSSGTVVGEQAFSDVFNAARDVAGVRKLVPGNFLLNGVADDVDLTTREFPQLGTVTIVDDDTGATL